MNVTALNSTIPLTFEGAQQVTTSVPFVVATAIVWFLPLFLWLIVGSIARARSSDGRVLSSPMISSVNFWYAFLIWGLIQAGLFLLIIFPFWLDFI